jgi:hypothetical protein
MLRALRRLTPASADVKRGAFFALAKKVTLFTVSWMQLLGFYLKISFISYGIKGVTAEHVHTTYQHVPISELICFFSK